MTAIVWVVRLLVLLIVIRLVMRAILGTSRVRGRSAPRQVERAGGTLERDPHCGTYVPRAAAVTVKSGRSTLYFCSPACRDAHLAARARAG